MGHGLNITSPQLCRYEHTLFWYTLHPMLHTLAHMSLNAEQPSINCPPIRSYLTKPTTWQGSNLTPSPSHSATWSQHLLPILQASIHLTPPHHSCFNQPSLVTQRCHNALNYQWYSLQHLQEATLGPIVLGNIPWLCYSSWNIITLPLTYLGAPE